MNRNLLSNLKEKKKVMKLSMAALVGAVTVCGAALCSASAMAPRDFSTLQGIDADQNHSAQSAVSGNVQGSTRQSAGFVVAAAGSGTETSSEVNPETEEGAENRAERLYEAIVESYDEDKDFEMLKEHFDLIDEVKKIAVACKEQYVIDLINIVKAAKICGGSRETDMQTRKIETGVLSANEICAVMDYLNELRILDVGWSFRGTYCYTVGDAGMKIIADRLKKNTVITGFESYHFCIGAEGAKYISEMLKLNTSLIKLGLMKDDVGAEGIRYISEAMMINTNITELDLGEAYIDDEGARMISKVLMENITLGKLDLNSNEIGDEGAKELSRALVLNTILTDLNLHWNRISDEGVKELSRALVFNTTLTELDLSWNQKIRDEGVEIISAALMFNTTLTKMDLLNDYLRSERELYGI